MAFAVARRMYTPTMRPVRPPMTYRVAQQPVYRPASLSSAIHTYRLNSIFTSLNASHMPLLQARFKMWKPKNVAARRQERAEYFKALKEKEKAQKKPMNEELAKYKEMILINADGKQLGVKSYADSMKIALEGGYNLVMVVPGQVPVCRLMSPEEKPKKPTKMVFKRSSEDVTKEIRIRDVITDHDLAVKLRKVNEFLHNGHKVKLLLMFKKRDDFDMATATELLNNIIGRLKDLCQKESSIKQVGDRFATVTIGPSTSLRNQIKRERAEKLKQKELEKQQKLQEKQARKQANNSTVNTEKSDNEGKAS